MIGRLKKNTAESFMMNDKDYQEQPQMNKTVDTIKKEKEEVSLKEPVKRKKPLLKKMIRIVFTPGLAFSRIYHY